MPPFFTEEIMEMDWREETLESLLAYFNKIRRGRHGQILPFIIRQAKCFLLS